MKFIIVLIIICLFLHINCVHLQAKEGNDQKCYIIINGVDLSTKIKDKIVGLISSQNDPNTQMSVTRVTVKDNKGNTRQVNIKIPFGKNGISQIISCNGGNGNYVNLINFSQKLTPEQLKKQMEQQKQNLKQQIQENRKQRLLEQKQRQEQKKADEQQERANKQYDQQDQEKTTKTQYRNKRVK